MKQGLVIGKLVPLVKKVCFYGPESTGKSTMAKRLAKVYQTEYVPEVAKEIITSNAFTLEDIEKIGHAQSERIEEKLKTANRILFCDTDLITTQIYAAHYLHQVPPILYDLENRVTYDLYFLFDIDIAWVPDGLRDLRENRREMYEIFKSELILRKIPFVPVNGNYTEREKCVREKIDSLLAVND